MTNTSESNNIRKHTSMGNNQRGNTKIVRSATSFQTLNAHAKNKRGRKDSDCDQSNLRPKSTESVVYQSAPNTTKNGSPRLKSSPRASPSKEGCTRCSPGLTNHYAGAKFTEPPAPTSLPKPPSHWTSFVSQSIRSERMDKCHPDFSRQLKMLLKVQA